MQTCRRLDVALFIIHPTLTPSEITNALGLTAEFTHGVGDQRTTPKGTILPGVYPDTRWRHLRRFEVLDQWFAAYIAELVGYLEPHEQFLHDLRLTGGSATIILQWLGDGHLGDNITKDLLAKMVQLHLELGLEVYPHSLNGEPS